MHAAGALLTGLALLLVLGVFGVCLCSKRIRAQHQRQVGPAPDDTTGPLCLGARGPPCFGGGGAVLPVAHCDCTVFATPRARLAICMRWWCFASPFQPRPLHHRMPPDQLPHHGIIIGVLHVQDAAGDDATADSSGSPDRQRSARLVIEPDGDIDCGVRVSSINKPSWPSPEDAPNEPSSGALWPRNAR